MFCPFKFNEKTLDSEGYPVDGNCQCQQEGCQLWNVSLGQCGLVAQAYLTGLEVERKEAKIS